jgi:hypothetical protein
MVSNAPGSYPYRVVLSEEVADSVRELHRRAMDQGRGEQFLAALRVAVDRMRMNPNAFGDPNYRLPALHLTVRCAAISPMGFHFAVHEYQPIVFLTSIKLMSQGPSKPD